MDYVLSKKLNRERFWGAYESKHEDTHIRLYIYDKYNVVHTKVNINVRQENEKDKNRAPRQNHMVSSHYYT